MTLQWVRYNQSYVLVVRLGEHAGKAYLLDARKTPDGEVAQLRGAWTQLRTLSLEKRISWIKQHCPIAYREAFRQWKDGGIQVLQEY